MDEFMVEKEENKENCKLHFGDTVQFNIKAEADAIENYNRLLVQLNDSDIPSRQKEFVQKEIYEIIGDELNHIERLKAIYSLITDIKESED